ncbi:MAG: acyl-ACP--UDP-N-acetylglucosamine O-acyltransferase [Bacteroidales bacterium]|mgnify:CR=1 FL=1|jgi:UDP-N-acetylglucosamine acyltransferase|nr:acyl-ACP--UDP-N-acetylglucosamine O-acyltransferase [Bacteroidales bacterium]MDI9591982.1 acyl-ACP--UDP-N-acetylglucosamine O-acyltransferase [Bacteroidota bacterium]NLH32928.1 acyl-ACP--UDP-N-acetylglucosamine O-acyltransferase [Lentimicrobium sp.]OQC37784.1 MAG: Acyl-(acyl-carrier-protein)--UDP-N-acetylglucosamine O-acyltransferase [Bacteroidetes bacterium ADurb.Bin041]MBP7873910.1 acyl-ACP--UDP-N-acetylglucosamine O-acyltransferase [Bacteroidales bacterium]
MNQPLAYVHPQAKIAKNVVIEPFVNIEKNVEIDEGTWIGSNVTIMDGARIGKNCRIFPGAVISAIPQDLKFAGEDTVVKIGDNTTIREFVTINRGTKANNETVIGNNCLLMAYVHIAHDCVIRDNVILANAATLAGHIVIDDWAIVGGMAAVHQFVQIGAHSFISGGALVRKDVPPFTKAAREPLSYVGVNSIGLRRRGFSNERINAIQEVYRILYIRGYNTSQAVSIIEADFPASADRDEILAFISRSTRGLMKGYGKIDRRIL